MIIVRHYVNLVGWRDIHNVMVMALKTQQVKHIFFCDSISLWIAARITGKSAILLPGPVAISEVNSLPDDAVQYLSAKSISRCHVVLPFFKDDSELLRFSSSFLPLAKNIVIGISSPRQNKLAFYIAETLSEKFPDYEYNVWCFGAAVYVANEPASRVGFIWIVLLFKKPIRTIKKIATTIIEIISALRPANRILFKKFTENLE